MFDFDAIVLAGGSARRLGGADKPMELVDGTPLLCHVLDAVADAQHRVVVGPTRDLPVDVSWVREDPPGSGPVAAVAAGLPLTSAAVVLLLAADLPRIAPAITPLRTAVQHGAPAAILLTEGRLSYLAAAWRRDALQAALGRLPDVTNAAMRSLYDRISAHEVHDTQGWGQDCDTWDDLADAQARGGRR